MGISIIVAHDIHGGIGRDNDLLWDLPRDKNHFRRLTLGNTIVMGRKTYDSIGRPLDKRTNIVLTRNKKMRYPKPVKVAHTHKSILSYAKIFPQEEVFIIGGEEIYKKFLPYADTLYVTEVIGEFKADTHFPLVSQLHGWKMVDFLHSSADENNPYDMYFKTYKREGRQV